jgi:hypothetical protein
VPVILGAWGDPTRDTLLGYRDLGIEAVVLGPGRAGWDDPTSVPAFIDRYAPLAAELRG